jgi:hypothetical protein
MLKKIKAETMDAPLYGDLDKKVPLAESFANPVVITLRSYLQARVGKGVPEYPMNPENVEKFLSLLEALRKPGDLIVESGLLAFLGKLIDAFKIQEVCIYVDIMNALKSAVSYEPTPA